MPVAAQDEDDKRVTRHAVATAAEEVLTLSGLQALMRQLLGQQNKLQEQRMEEQLQRQSEARERQLEKWMQRQEQQDQRHHENVLKLLEKTASTIGTLCMPTETSVSDEVTSCKDEVQCDMSTDMVEGLPSKTEVIKEDTPPEDEGQGRPKEDSTYDQDGKVSEEDRLREVQMHDADLQLVIQWLEKRQKPMWSEVAILPPRVKQYWFMWETLCWKNGLVHRKWMSTDGTTRLQLVVPSACIQEVLTKMHDDQRHCGTTKTVIKVRQHFFWVGYRADVAKWCRCCVHCNKSLSEKLLKVGYRTTVADKPLQRASWCPVQRRVHVDSRIGGEGTGRTTRRVRVIRLAYGNVHPYAEYCNTWHISYQLRCTRVRSDQRRGFRPRHGMDAGRISDVILRKIRRRKPTVVHGNRLTRYKCGVYSESDRDGQI